MDSAIKDVLEEIRDLLLPQESVSFVVASDTTDWTTVISPPLQLTPKKKYELALVNLETYNSIPNIGASNNSFVYSSDGGQNWNTIVLPEGSYELSHICAEIQHQLRNNGDWDDSNKKHFISIGANSATLRAYINIKNESYKVDLRASTIRTTLGFDPQILTSGHYYGENPVDILTVDSILVNCDLVNGSYKNGSHQPVVYSFFPSVGPGHKIIETPHNLVYLPVGQTGSLSRIRVWLTDQNGSQLNLRGETVVIRLHLRSI